MSDPQQDRPVSVPELLESLRRLVREDPAFGLLVDEICRDGFAHSSSPEMAREALALAQLLGHAAWEVVDAAADLGLGRTLVFLRRQAERRAAEAIPVRVM